MILVDTNVLLRIVQPGHPHRQPAMDAIELLRTRDGEQFAVCPQCLYEMYVVCTRPVRANGLGMTPEHAHAEIVSTRGLFQVLPETAQVYPTWEGLIAKYPVTGKRAHDSRIVALMVDRGVANLLTYNDIDFQPFVEISALNPFDVLDLPRV